MNITIIIYVVLFLFAGTIGYLYYLLYKKKEENKKLKTTEKTLKENLKENILNLKLREGFYEMTFKLAEKEDTNDSSDYDTKIHVIETEKYVNGYSKIKHVKTDVLSGFSPNQYEYVKTLSVRKFDTLVETDNIEWLEVDQDIKELRINKINSVLKEIENDGKK